MVQLSLSFNCQDANLERALLTIIQTSLDDVVATHNATIEALIAMMAICERNQGNTEEVMEL